LDKSLYKAWSLCFWTKLEGLARDYCWGLEFESLFDLYQINWSLR
jgi:hypothetical protein